MEDVILSVLVPTYNHENYIKKALDSILMQKTQYKYEVLVGDDVSTDNTREVLKKYELLYPNKIHVIYRDFNLWSAKDRLDNHMDLYHRAKGKYVIFLEGDDYWIDNTKIEKQVSFLEKNSDYIAVACNCIVVDENGDKTKEIYPECKEKEYTLEHYIRNIIPGQLATVMMRNIYKLDNFETSMWEKRLVPGDRIYYFTLLTKGKIYCIQEIMSAYRHVVCGGTSYSANIKYDFSYDELWYSELLKFAIRSKKDEFIRAAKILYLTCLVRAKKNHALSNRQILSYILKNKISFMLLLDFLIVYGPIYFKKSLMIVAGIKTKRI